MANKLTSRCVAVRKLWASAVGVALFLQALVPNGFMPGQLSDGWLVALCPQGLPAEFVRHLKHADSANPDHAGHAQHHGEDAPSSACELGSAFDQPVDTLFAGGLQNVDLSTEQVLLARASQVAARLVRSARSRAPPIS